MYELDRENEASRMLGYWMIVAVATGAALGLLLREADYLTWAAIVLGAAFGVTYCTLSQRESMSIGVVGCGILVLGVAGQGVDLAGCWSLVGLICLGLTAALVVYAGWPAPKFIGRWLRNVWTAWRKAGEVTDALTKRTAR